MADGKIAFEASVETKEARKELASLEKDFTKMSETVDKLSTKLDKLKNKRLDSAGSEKFKQNIIDAEKQIDSLTKKIDSLKSRKSALIELAKGLASNGSRVSDLYKFSQQPGVNAGLVAANAKNWGVNLGDLEQFKSYATQIKTIDKELDTIPLRIKQTQDEIAGWKQWNAQVPAPEKTEKEIELEEQLRDVLEQRVQLMQKIEEAKQRVEEAEQADADDAENEAKLQRQIALREKIRSVITSCGNALKWSAQMGFRFVKSLTIDRLTKGFSKLTAGVRNFGRRLKFVILQGLLFRNLRKYLSEFAQSIGSAFSQNEQLNASLANLKGTFWASIAPVVDALAPIIARFIDMIAKLITYLSGLIGILFNIGKASKAAGAGLAKAGQSGKEASKNLASWDTIQNLDKGSSGGADSGISPTFGQDFEEAYSGLEKFRELFEKGDWFEIGKYVGEKLNEVVDVVDEWVTSKLNPALKKIGKNIAKFINGFVVGFDFKKFGKLIADIFNGIIENIATFFETLNTDELGRAFSDIINGIFENFDVTRLGQAISEIFKKVLSLLVSFIENTDWQLVGNKVAEFIGSIDFGGIAKVFFEGIGAALGGLALFLFGLVEQAINDVKEWWAGIMEEAGGDVALGILLGIVDVFKNIYEWIKEHIFQPIIDGIKKVFGINSPAEEMKPLGGNIAQGLLEGIKNVFKSIKEWVDINIMTPIANAIKAQIDKIKNSWNELKQKIIDIWTTIKTSITEKVNAIRDKVLEIVSRIKAKWEEFKLSVSNVFDTISTKASDAWNGMKNGVRSVINWMIRFINRLIGGIESAINWVIDGINKIKITPPQWATNLFGIGSIGFNLGRVSLGRISEIPALAQGGVVNPGHAFTAILGDNRHEQEIVSPLSTMKQALLEALQESGMSDGGQIILNIDGRQVATAIVPHMNNASRAYGRSVIR